MKKKILLLWFLGLTLNLQADEVPLDRKSHSDVSQSEIPINVDIDKSLLSINFLKANKTFVTILGPDGVVYQREITSDNINSVYIDLAMYQEGDYTIYFQDENGDTLEGEFTMEKE